MFESDRTVLVDDLRNGLRALVHGLDERTVGDDVLLQEAREIEELGRLLDAARVILAGEIADRSRSELGDERLSARRGRSEEHTSELQSLMRISYAVFCLKKKKQEHNSTHK